MRVRLMQLVDFWIGVPLCALLSVWHYCAGFFQKVSDQPARKILFIELSEMGSAILAYSALVRAREIAGAADNADERCPYFLIFARNRESCEILEVVPRSHVLVIDDRSFVRFALSALVTLLRVRKLGFDAVIDLELFSRFTALFTYLSGARVRVGFSNHTNEGLFRGNFLTHPVTYNPHQHMSLNFLALVCALEENAKERPLLKRDVSAFVSPLPRQSREASERSAMWKLVSETHPHISEGTALIVFNPDPGDAIPIRGWPEGRFIEVAKDLLGSYPTAAIVVTGLLRSRPYAERMQRALGNERVIDLTGKTKALYDVVTLFSMAQLLITNDSGPAHVASLAGLATVVLFGPETPELYGPLGDACVTLYAHYSCSPCLTAANHRYTTCTNNRCLQAISSGQVLSVARGLLQERGLRSSREPTMLHAVKG